jgi:hypothetical protein
MTTNKKSIQAGALKRRMFLQGAAAAAVAPVVFTRNAWAQGKSLQIGIYSGSQGEYVKKSVIPASSLRLIAEKCSITVSAHHPDSADT